MSVIVYGVRRARANPLITRFLCVVCSSTKGGLNVWEVRLTACIQSVLIYVSFLFYAVSVGCDWRLRFS